MEINVIQLVCALIDSAGGEVRFPAKLMLEPQEGDKVLALDVEDDGETFVVRLLDAEDENADV